MEIMTKAADKKKVSCDDVAEYFIATSNASGDPVTNLKLQKLVYYAQAWYLANERKPLFDEEFEAWVHGPVIPKLYHSYKKFGSSPIIADPKVEEIQKRLGKEVTGFLDEIANVYMPHGAYYLERMTHEEAPWADARKGCKPTDSCSNIIPKATMQAFYGERLKEDRRD